MRDRVDARRVAVIDAVGVQVRLAKRLLDRLVWPLGLDDQEREAAAPDRIVGDVAVALAGPLIDLGRFHVVLGPDPFLGDAEEARLD